MTNNDTIAYITEDGANAPAGSAGVTWKVHIDTLSNGSILAETIYPNYLMDNIVFHDLEIRNTFNEGMYIGNTAPNGGDQQGPPGFYPVRMRRLSIYNCYVHHTGWDAIQTSGATDFCLIFGNTVYDYGYLNVGGQQCGIIQGGTTNTNVFNNSVIKGTGNGYEIFGYGTMLFHDNYADSCGRDGTTNGQQTFYQDDRPSVVTSYPGQKVYIYNNTFLHPMPAGAIVSRNDNGTALADSIYNNVFCIPGASPSTWVGLYIQTNPAAAFASSNTLTTSCGTTPPTVNPGPNQQIVYPAQTSVTMAGSATGNGGATISTTVWVWVSGPNHPTITTPSSLTTTVTGLVPGTYVLQLQATDSNSNTTVAQMQVFVIQSVYILRKRSHKRKWR